MSKENIPDFMLQFCRGSPTSYTRDDIFHLEPLSENAVFLKYLVLLNGEDSGGGNDGKIRGFITSDDKDFMTSSNLIFTVEG